MPNKNKPTAILTIEPTAILTIEKLSTDLLKQQKMLSAEVIKLATVLQPILTTAASPLPEIKDIFEKKDSHYKSYFKNCIEQTNLNIAQVRDLIKRSQL